MYKHLEAGWILRLSDGACIPPDIVNNDYITFLNWQEKGGIAAAYVPPVPFDVSRRQFKQALTRIGLRAAVEAAVVASDQDTKDWYADSLRFERANPVMNAMAAALGKSSADTDGLFRLAATL